MKIESLNISVDISILNLGQLKENMRKYFNSDKSILVFASRRAIISIYGNSLPIELVKSNINIVSDIAPNPTYQFALNIFNKAPKNIDTIIAIGGGSCIDLAKIVIAIKNSSNIQNYDQFLTASEKKQKCTPIIIAVPTTAGTGSDVTNTATIWDEEKKKKYSIEREYILPTKSWIVPELTLSMPEKITISTGLDALCHSIEAYWAKSSNSIVRRLSSIAIKEIITNLKRCLEKPNDIKARTGMCLGAMFAGLAISQTRTTACHALSYKLTSYYSIPHGIAVGMMLIPIMKINWDSIQEKDLFIESIRCSSVEGFEKFLGSILEDRISLNFEDYKISKEDRNKLWDMDDFTNIRMGNNPVNITKNKILEIL